MLPVHRHGFLDLPIGKIHAGLPHPILLLPPDQRNQGTIRFLPNLGVHPPALNAGQLRVVADHARTCVFLIGDGVIPGNEGRGYVLRRLMRRVVRMMRLLGAHDPVIGELVDTSVLTMAPQYPELNDEVRRIRTVAVAEEAAFLQTLRAGTAIFDTAASAVRSAGGSTLPGAQASRAKRRRVHR